MAESNTVQVSSVPAAAAHGADATSAVSVGYHAMLDVIAGFRARRGRRHRR